MPSTVSIQTVKNIIGEEAVQKLAEQLPGKLFYMPKKGIKFPDLAARNKFIKELYESGTEIETIAEIVGLSCDRVRKITYLKSI